MRGDPSSEWYGRTGASTGWPPADGSTRRMREGPRECSASSWMSPNASARRKHCARPRRRLSSPLNRVGSPNPGAFVCFHVPLGCLHRSAAKGETVSVYLVQFSRNFWATTRAMPPTGKIGSFEWDCNFAVDAGCGRVHHCGDQLPVPGSANRSRQIRRGEPPDG